MSCLSSLGRKWAHCNRYVVVRQRSVTSCQVRSNVREHTYNRMAKLNALADKNSHDNHDNTVVHLGQMRQIKCLHI